MPDFKIHCWYSLDKHVPSRGRFDNIVHSHCRHFQYGTADCFDQVRAKSGRIIAEKLLQELKQKLGHCDSNCEPCWHIVVQWNDVVTQIEERLALLRKLQLFKCLYKTGDCTYIRLTFPQVMPFCRHFVCVDGKYIDLNKFLESDHFDEIVTAREHIEKLAEVSRCV